MHANQAAPQVERRTAPGAHLCASGFFLAAPKIAHSPHQNPRLPAGVNRGPVTFRVFLGSTAKVEGPEAANDTAPVLAGLPPWIEEPAAAKASDRMEAADSPRRVGRLIGQWWVEPTHLGG
jgi:hypothetical protein